MQEQPIYFPESLNILQLNNKKVLFFFSQKETILYLIFLKKPSYLNQVLHSG